jgi:predicted TIM-barrel fold metal-dependent hydrolase
MSTFEQQARPVTLPVGATDCHSHVVGLVERWPMIADRRYEPEQGPVADYIATLAALGLSRCVLVQPSIYGTDNGCQIEAMQEIGCERCRGVAVVSANVAASDLRRLHEAGMRGVRFNLRSGGLGVDDLETVCRKIAPLGWHAQIFTAAPVIAEREELLRQLPAPVVIDHMGGPDPAEGLAQPGFQALLRLLEDRVAWVKLSGAERLSAQEHGYDDVVPFARALIAAAPERAVWGIDWPPSRFYKVQPTPNDWIEQLLKYVEQPGSLQSILVDNPAALYGFAPADAAHS